MADTISITKGSGSTPGAAGAAATGAASHGSPSLVDRALGPYRMITRFLERRALVRVARAVPRALRFISTSALDGSVVDAVSSSRFAPLLAVGVAADEAFLAVAMAPSRFPRRTDYDRVSAELVEARQLFASHGWLDDPASYHRTPPPLAVDDVSTKQGWAMGLAYERIAYDSGYSPRAGEPGDERWVGFAPNRTASAAIVRHVEGGGGARPWLVCVHGFAMGYPFMDFPGLHTAQLHRTLGANVALPVLPLHGPRKVTRMSGEPFLSFDLMNTLHGFAQAVWDIRRLLSWIRDQGATSIGLYGVSLGAYVVSLLAGLEDGLDAVVAGIPMVDLPALFHEQSPLHVRARAIEHNIIGGNAEALFAAVSPLAVAPKVPVDRRFIFAGYGDRLALPEHARRLWEYWEHPQTSWYWGSHVGYLWSRQVATFLQDSLVASGLRHEPISARVDHPHDRVA
ncbi:MAG: alpha/beta hydrolase family protein [Acidimicrobiales bacterium]